MWASGRQERDRFIQENYIKLYGGDRGVLFYSDIPRMSLGVTDLKYHPYVYASKSGQV
jgi:TnpA family transposase